MAHGDVLVDLGDKPVPFFVAVSGEIEVVRSTDSSEARIWSYHAGQFSGEGALITGRPALAPLRVAEAGQAIEMDRDDLLAFVIPPLSWRVRRGLGRGRG